MMHAWLPLSLAIMSAGAGELRPVPELLTVVNAPPGEVSPSTRQQAMRDLARHGTPESSRAVLDALARAETAELATQALRELPPAHVKPALPACARSPIPRVRSTCLMLCARVGDLGCAAPMMDAVTAPGDGGDAERLVSGLFAVASRERNEDLARRTLALSSRKELAGAVRRGLYAFEDPALAPVARPLLSHADAEFRTRGCRTLQKMNDAGALDVMLKRVAVETDGNTARCLVDAVAELSPPNRAQDAGAALAALARRDDKFESAVIKALVKLRQPGAYGPHLVEKLGAREYIARDRAARALRDLRYEPAADALARVVSSDPEESVKRSALPALAGVASTDEHVAPFRAALDDPRLESAAREAIRQFRRPEVSPYLFPLLKHRESQVRRAVAHALGELGDPRSGVPLMDVIENDDTDFVVAAAAEELHKVAAPDHLPRLLAILRKPHGSGRGGAMERAVVTVDRAQEFKVILPLVRAHDPLGRALALRLASDVHPSDEVVFQAMAVDKDLAWRRESMYGLSQLRTSSARQALCRAMATETDPGLRSSATEGLGAFQDEEAADCLIRAWESFPRGRFPSLEEEIVRALRRISGMEFGQDLQAWKTWRAGGFGVGRGDDAMLSALRHENARVRALAARQLARPRGKQDVNTVADAVMAALEEEKDADARVAMLELVGKLGRTRDIPALVGMLEKRASMPERVALARALDALGDGRGTLAFMEDLQSDSPQVRADAVRALSQVTGEPFRPQPAWWQEWWKTYSERYRR